MKRILANLAPKQLKQLDSLVENLGYRSRSEAIRDALQLLSQSETSKELKQMLEKMQRIGTKRLSIRQIEEKILSSLQKNPAGLSILEIAQLTGLHRHTVRKYATLLISRKILAVQNIGTKKICCLSTGFKHRRFGR